MEAGGPATYAIASKPTREQVKQVVRKLIANRAGEKFAPNLFKDSVDQIMKEYENATQTNHT